MKVHKNSVFLWKDILDLGLNSCLAFLKKKRKSQQKALEELRRSFSRQSEEHWQALYRALKRLEC